MSRYRNRIILNNKSNNFSEQFKNRNLNSIRHYESSELNYPTISQVRKLTRISHVWSLGDRFYKLAFKYYGNSADWWVIAQYNKKPTEGHVNPGDIIYIPLPLEQIKKYFGA